jgi:2-polyprenyl-3-methyl-5-hydroxy-6-metoxy-1,4-benzoquinol methylase
MNSANNIGNQVLADTSSVACPYCEGTSPHLLSSADVNRRITTEVFHFYQCPSCELMFLHPRPADMSPFYKGGYEQIPENLSQLRVIAKKDKYRMEPILRYKKGGRLLEIGPWMGIFSCNAKDAGFDVTAIEMNRQCVDFLNDVVGIKAIQSSDPVTAMNSMDEQFDVIALWHSLEHLPNPWLVVQKAAERLAPGGILLIAVPNIESYDFSVLKAGWLHLDAPRHLFFYTARSLEKLCSSSGLKTLELTTSDQLSRILSRDAWHVRAVSIIPIKYVRGVLGLLLYQIAKRKSKGKHSGLTAIFTNPG